MARIRVLIVDDSATNRRAIARALAPSPAIHVVGTAEHGEEALQFVELLKPDAVTLDLEMPKMGGFAFLRILMVRKPMPVIVVSTYSQQENVFRALELGALDFVAKPDAPSPEEWGRFRDELINKLHALDEIGRPTSLSRTPPAPVPSQSRAPFSGPPKLLVGIAASTGGPAALMEILRTVTPRPEIALLIAQHMPEKFTRTFARRLDQQSGFGVTEAQHGDRVVGQCAYVCPGRQCMEVVSGPGGFRIELSPPHPDDRYVPSGDRLFASIAKAGGRRTAGVVLTGMGDDGSRGAGQIVQAGGSVVAESETTAVVCGMPGAVARAGVESKRLPLGAIAEWLDGLGR